MKTNLLYDAVIGVIYFAIVYTLIKMVQPHGVLAIIGVLFGCTFLLYRFFYGITSLKHYITAFFVISTIVLAFDIAGKMGLIAATAVYFIVVIWVLYARRNRIKEAYKIFETEADKVFYKVEVKEEKPKTVKAKKPSSPSKKDKSEHKHKQKARKKDSHKASKSSTVKKNSKKRAKKTTAK